MKIAGITAEYNPLHFGHLYHIRQTKAALGEDAGIVCVMSGNFMQRGDVAILEKHARAEAAVRCGADLVLELPLTYALASAERFAYGAMSIFDALGNVGYISFGSESGDVSEIERAVDVLLRPEMDKLIVENLKDGTSYAAARMASAEKISGRRMQVLVQPNDILAVEYGKAIRRLNSDMELLPVKRQGAGHDSLEHAERISAMELRRRIACGDGVEESMPEESADILRREIGMGRAPVDMGVLETAILSKLRTMSDEDYECLPDVSEGLHRRFKKYAVQEASVNDILMKVKTKRYSMARLRRIMLYAFLGITREDMQAQRPEYVKVLAMNGRGKEILKAADKKIPVLSKPAHGKYLSLSVQKQLALEARATDLYSLAYPEVCRRIGGQEWKLSPIVVQH